MRQRAVRERMSAGAGGQTKAAECGTAGTSSPSHFPPPSRRPDALLRREGGAEGAGQRAVSSRRATRCGGEARCCHRFDAAASKLARAATKVAHRWQGDSIHPSLKPHTTHDHDSHFTSGGWVRTKAGDPREGGNKGPGTSRRRESGCACARRTRPSHGQWQCLSESAALPRRQAQM